MSQRIQTGRTRHFTVSVLASTLAVFLVAGIWAGGAQATLTVDIVWVGTTGSGTTGGTIIEAVPGDRLTADIFVYVDAAGVRNYSMSVVVDVDLMDELDIVSTEEFDHVRSLSCMPLPNCFNNFGPELNNANVGVEAENESDDMNEGSVDGFEAVTLTWLARATS